jgi:hypothetical protein
VALEFTYLELQRELREEMQGKKQDESEDGKARRERMRKYLQEEFETEDINAVNPDELKDKMNGAALISRIQYRKQVANSGSARSTLIKKNDVMRLEHMSAKNLDQSTVHK